MKYKAIIVDDELNAQNILEELLQKYPEIEVVGKFCNAEDALQSITKYKPDLIFLDIDMPGKSGLDLAFEIRDKNINTNIIFITAFNQHAIEAFKVAAFDYILKPVDQDELKKTIERFIIRKEKYNLSEKIDKLHCCLAPEKLRFNTRTGFVLVNPKEIIYLKADGNYTFIHKTLEERVHVSLQIGKIEDQLNSSIFIRINRSLIINKSYISSFDRKSRILKLSGLEEEIKLKISRELVKKFN